MNSLFRFVEIGCLMAIVFRLYQDAGDKHGFAYGGLLILLFIVAWAAFVAFSYRSTEKKP